MISVHDVAAYILVKLGKITTFKLHKLLYYCQAWSLVWDSKPLFQAHIWAWPNGPRLPEIYKRSKGKFKVAQWKWGSVTNLNKTQKETINAVLKFYGDKTGQQLNDLIWQEHPFWEAQHSLVYRSKGKCRITQKSMVEYYSSLMG